MSAVKMWVAISIGGAAGAAVALLYAPQAGTRTRRELRRKLENANEYLKDTAESVTGQAGKYVKRGKDVMENVVDTASSAYTVARKVVSIG